MALTVLQNHPFDIDIVKMNTPWEAWRWHVYHRRNQYRSIGGGQSDTEDNARRAAMAFLVDIREDVVALLADHKALAPLAPTTPFNPPDEKKDGWRN